MLARTQVLEFALGELGNLEALQQGVDPGIQVLDAVDMTVDLEVFANGEHPIEAGERRGHIHAPPDCHLLGGKVLVKDLDRAAISQDQAEQDVDRGGFACAVGAEEPEELSPFHAER